MGLEESLNPHEQDQPSDLNDSETQPSDRIKGTTSAAAASHHHGNSYDDISQTTYYITVSLLLIFQILGATSLSFIE